jgi:hypothetical protein
MVKMVYLDHIDSYFDGDLRNLKHMIDDESGKSYNKHSYSAADQRRIHYIKLKKQMQREEQMEKQVQNIIIYDESDSDGSKYKKKLKADKHEQHEKKGKKK